MDDSNTSAASATALLPAVEVTRQAQVIQAANGIFYAIYGDSRPDDDIQRIVEAVPSGIAPALQRRAYYFVPLAIAEDDQVHIAPAFAQDLSDRALCHKNLTLGSAECTFISTRLAQDRFALAFEFFINVGHQFVDTAGVPASFHELVWRQADSQVRGETSHDAWDYRQRAHSGDEKARSQFFEATFADVLAIYMLASTVDFDYHDLREREYPLLVAPALAERLRHVAALFPPNHGYEFEIRYRRRS
ncbi:MAG: hypothetical protein ACP5M4_06840 [Acidobacteriaceae bacterium]